MEVDKGIKLETTETEELVNNGLKLNAEYEGCTSCFELQEKFTEAEEKFISLDIDIGKTTSVVELVDCILCYMETLKQRNDELQMSIQNGKEECDEKITELMIENEVLDCEKKRAERETEVWKAKCRELEKGVIDLEKKLSAVMTKPSSFSPAENENNANEDKDASGTPTMNTPCKQHSDVEVFNGRSKGLKHSNRTCLKFSTKGSEYKNISPSTPGVGRHFGPIDISDSDDDTPISPSYNKRPPFCKRRRVACIVSSESEHESASDDDIPIGRLCGKRKKEKEQLTHSSDTPPKRRRIVRAADRENSGVKITGRKANLGSPDINDSSGEDEEEEDDCEGESLDGFIVSESETETSDEMSKSDDLEIASGSSTEYRDIMADLRRERKDKLKWEYEADMLADLAKSPLLCMRAVCALYRQQTSEEKSCKETILRNGRGFSQIHAFRGSELAEFLTDGEQQGDVKKTEEELQEFDPYGIEQCRKLATNYSKQLFEIYKNDEDLFFHPEEI